MMTPSEVRASIQKELEFREYSYLAHWADELWQHYNTNQLRLILRCEDTTIVLFAIQQDEIVNDRFMAYWCHEHLTAWVWRIPLHMPIDISVAYTPIVPKGSSGYLEFQKVMMAKMGEMYNTGDPFTRDYVRKYIQENPQVVREWPVWKCARIVRPG